MSLLNYLRMEYFKSFFGAKEKNRTWERCIFAKQPTERYQTFKWTQWIDGTCSLEYKNIKKKHY